MKIESFSWVADANQNGQFGLAAVWHVLQWIYITPGNLLLEALGHVPVTANLFHIQASAQTGYYSLNSWFAALFSLLFWLCVLVELCNLRDFIQAKLRSRRHQPRPRHPHHWPHLHRP